MLNTSIKVIATQYTDDHGWSHISERKKTTVPPIPRKRTPTYHLKKLTLKRPIHLPMAILS